MNKITVLLFALGMTLFAVCPALAQEQPAQQPTATDEEKEKQKTELDKKTYRLLDQVIDEAQSLKLTENRVRVQINAADLLWDHNQVRARSLFSLAAEGVNEMTRTPENSNRQNQGRRPFGLRQELVLTVARHDAPLAYQLLTATRPTTTTQPVVGRGPLQNNSEDNLEQSLLAQVAALDPKLAAQNAEQMLDKGQFPRSLAEVIAQLQQKDDEAATKLTDKTLKRLLSAAMLANTDAATLAMSLLVPGPRPAAAILSDSTRTPRAQGPGISPVLDQAAYNDLLGTVIDSALKATPQQPNNQRAPLNSRGRGPTGGGQPNVPTELTDAQIEQGNARRLLAGLQMLLPQIDQYLPSRAQSIRQKFTEVGMDNSRANFAQTFSALQQGSGNADSLEQAAAVAPPMLKSRIYQQAAFKALDEGNTERARQIATDHLDGGARDVVMQRIDFRELATKAESARLDEVRQRVARLRSDNERIDLLIQMTNDLQKSNPKLARQLLEDARQITNRRATGYEHFEQQLKVAHAFAGIEPARSFEVLDPGISQLNELLSAAALLSGFEVDIFREGELPLRGQSGLTNMVTRYGQELALLAKSDFEQSETLAARFQLAESRIMARLAIVQGLLGVRPVQPRVNFLRGAGPDFMSMPNP
jgi:hypothetical protein